MIYGVKLAVSYFLGTDTAGRRLTVFPDDTFIVSYPRSGNTWVRFLVANLLHHTEAVSFTNIEKFVPDCEAKSSRYMKKVSRPRVIKSHEYFDHRYPRVLYIVRDPRDVVLSYYDFERKYRHIDDTYPLPKYVSDFVAGRLSSRCWGTWGENVGSWTSSRMGQESFLLLRYEDMKEDASVAVREIAEFFNIHAEEEGIKTALDRSSAQRMRQLEQRESDQWVSTKGKRADIPFIRAAVTGGWRSKLSSESIAEIEDAWGLLMKSLNYELVNRRAESDMSLRGRDHQWVVTRGYI